MAEHRVGDVRPTQLLHTYGVGAMVDLPNIAAMVMGNHLGRLWVWASIAILVAMALLMTPLAGGPMLRVRRALGLWSERQGPGFDPNRAPLSDDELAAARYPYDPEYLPVNRRRDGSIHDW